MIKVVMKKYQEPDAEWEETTMEDAILHLEEPGYWKPDTVKMMLEDGQTLWNPFCQYKMVLKDNSMQ